MAESHDWRRRTAIQIAAQLPDNPDDALVVLDYARELVGFLARPADDEERRCVVLSLEIGRSASLVARS